MGEIVASGKLVSDDTLYQAFEDYELSWVGADNRVYIPDSWELVMKRLKFHHSFLIRGEPVQVSDLTEDEIAALNAPTDKASA